MLTPRSISVIVVSIFVISLSAISIITTNANFIRTRNGNGDKNQSASDNFKITILHNNDIHSRFMETNIFSSPCKSKDKSKCFGGAARSVFLVKKIRATLGRDSVLYLNGGDHFQGTIWYNLFKWRAVTDFVINMEYDALTLGNHEFDDGVRGVVPYIKHVTNGTFSNGTTSNLHPKTPIVVSNLNISKEPQFWDGDHPIIDKSIVINKKGQNIGIIGYVTPDTKFLSSPGETLSFENEVDAVRREVDKLKSLNINIIIVISHGGFKADINLASAIPDIDIIVGGHTNTFLWTPGVNISSKFDPDAGSNRAPSIETPLDTYPKVVTSKDGVSQTLIVQAFAYGKYLGYLDVEFDADGKIVSHLGNPILLDAKIGEDHQTLKMMDFWSSQEDDEYKEVIGSSAIFLEGEDIVCRTRECSLGNLFSDMLVAYFTENFGREESSFELLQSSDATHNPDAKTDAEADATNYAASGWTLYPVAIINSGLIRTSLAPGEVAREDAMTVLPFKNKFEVLSVKGSILLDAIEHSVSAYDASGQRTEGRFLQFSGVKVKYDIRRQPGHRVVDVKIRCGHPCIEPIYEDLDTDKTYNVISSEYLDNGGDGYDMFANVTRLTCPTFNVSKVSKVTDANQTPTCVDVDIMETYIKMWSPLYAEVEDRITFVTDNDRDADQDADAKKVVPLNGVYNVNVSMVPAILLLILIKIFI